MVSLATIKASNATELPSTLPEGLTAMFLGATSGIGKSSLKQLAVATRNKSPSIYIVGRSARQATPLLAELRQLNSSATFTFIEEDVSLVASVDAAVDNVRGQESKLDLLFISVGFISFQGRKETSEGLEPSMTTRFYSRARAIELLLPLLNQSTNPHVTNVLAGGQEGPLIEDDLDLKRPGNYSFTRASVHSATMLTLVLERFARENPKISFVHAFPGLTATPVLTRGSSGIMAILLRWLVVPLLNTLVAANVDDVGARSLFYATNARYTVDDTAALATPLPRGLDKAKTTKGGVFLVDAHGESVDNESVLSQLRGSVEDKVWGHMRAVFGSVSTSK